MIGLKFYWRIMKGTLLCTGLISFSCGIAWAQKTERQWIPLDGQSEPGTPISVNIRETTPESTRLVVRVPGVWMSTHEYGGQPFTRLQLPPVELSGVGFPNKERPRGWYDFPEESGYPTLSPDRFRHALDASVAKPLYPLNAVGQEPATAKEMEELGIDPAGARPGIPSLRGLFAVAAGANPTDIKIQTAAAETQIVETPEALIPAGYEGRDQVKDPVDGYIPPQLVDKQFYEEFKGEYQGVEQPVSEVSSSSLFPAAQFRVPLMTYQSPQAVSVATTMELVISHPPFVVERDCLIPWDLWINVLPVINGEALANVLRENKLTPQPTRSARYLIVTPQEYEKDLQNFADWKTSKGLVVDWAFVGSDAGDDVAPDRAEIDAFLEAYFKQNYCHGVYVLLVGDVDVIPAGRSDRVGASPDGNDADSDHVYEVLGDDRFPSLYVGRLSVNSAEELNTQLAKILDYERSPVGGDWPTQTTLAANSQNDDGSYGVSSSFPSKYAAAVNAIAGYGSYSNPPTFEVLHAGAASSGATRAVNQDVIDAVDEGRGHLLYRGHGGQNAWVSGWDGSSTTGTDFTDATHIPMLANDAYPIVYSIACQNARLRADDSISEAWMSDEQGAVAHFGASVNSYTTENHERAKGIFKAMYENGFSRLGPALAEAERLSYNATGGGGAWDNNTFCYLLLGDPELTVRKNHVFSIADLSAVLTNTVGANGLTVELAGANKEPVSAALVNVVMQDGSQTNAFTGIDGRLLLPAVQKDQVAEVQIHADGYGYKAVTPSSSKPQWVPFEPEAEPGDPVQVSVIESGPENTTFSLKLPGVYLTSVQYGGREFTKVEMPEGLLDGLGFPKEPGERGWYDFPADTDYPLLPQESYRRAYSISTPKPVFPLEALGAQPTTGKEMEELGIDPAGARPGIPALRGFLAVARGTTAEDLQFEMGDQQTRTMELSAPLAPAGFEGRDQAAVEDPIDGYSAPELIDEEFYNSFEGSYIGTEAPLSPVSGAGAFAAVEVRAPMVELITPSQLEVVTGLTLQIKHLRGTVDFDCPIPWDSWIFKMPYINGHALRESLTTKGIEIQASRSAHYLILTPQEYRDELEEFARWKQSKGLNVDFAYVGNGADDDIAPERNKIDAFIEQYFQENFCHGVYVLLVGDVDVIPAGRSNRVGASPDGNNADSDHVYEVLGDDRFPSLYVGRLSVNSAEELNVQLGKILEYERNPTFGDWPTRATLAANSQNDDGSYGVSSSFPSKYAAAVNAIAAYGSYSNPPTFEVLHAGTASSDATRAVNQDVIDAVDAGSGHLLYRGHGGQNAWVSGWDGSSTLGNNFTSGTHIPMLANDAYPIVYSIACQNARLRVEDSISEVWMSDEQGAVAHFSASVNSYTTENHERAKGIFKAMYENGFNRLGPALAEAERLSYNATGGGGGWDNNTFCYLLLGDPELTVRKDPVRLDFEITTSVSSLENGLVVELKDPEGRPLAASLVNLVLQDGTQTNGFTGTEGQLVLPDVQKDQVSELQIHADGFHGEELPVEPDQPITLRAMELDPDGQFRLLLIAAPGSYTVEGSTDLESWKEVDTVNVEGDSQEVMDAQAAGLDYRYYRARPSQQ